MDDAKVHALGVSVVASPSSYPLCFCSILWYTYGWHHQLPGAVPNNSGFRSWLPVPVLDPQEVSFCPGVVLGNTRHLGDWPCRCHTCLHTTESLVCPNPARLPALRSGLPQKNNALNLSLDPYFNKRKGRGVAPTPRPISWHRNI